jgi:hypothetical protein
MWPTHYIPNQPRIDGVPPPRYYLTTPPYPYEFGDAIAANALALDGLFGIESIESLTTSGSALSGSLVERLVEYAHPPEALDVTGSALNSTLVERLRTYEGESESLAVAGSALSGVLKDPLISYNNWPLVPDELASSGSALGGTLT